MQPNGSLTKVVNSLRPGSVNSTLCSVGPTERQPFLTSSWTVHCPKASPQNNVLPQASVVLEIVGCVPSSRLSVIFQYLRGLPSMSTLRIWIHPPWICLLIKVSDLQTPGVRGDSRLIVCSLFCPGAGIQPTLDSSLTVQSPGTRFSKRHSPCPSVTAIKAVPSWVAVISQPGMPTFCLKPILPSASNLITSRQGSASTLKRTFAQSSPLPLSVTGKAARVKGCHPSGTASSTVQVPAGSVPNSKCPLGSALNVWDVPSAGVIVTLQPLPLAWW